MQCTASLDKWGFKKENAINRQGDKVIRHMHTDTHQGKNCIIFFIKAPVAGLVKSRLAEHTGFQGALFLYRAFVADILLALKETGVDIRIYFYPSEYASLVRRWLGDDTRLFAQKGADLGLRMYNAFCQSALDGYDRMILVGSDIPHLSGEIIADAFSGLLTHHAVIGPAMDGGYYLIGFNKETLSGDAFTNITWGGPDVLEKTRHRLNQNNHPVYMLTPLHDIDTWEDLCFLASSLADQQGAASTHAGKLVHTRRVLSEMKLLF